MQNQVQIFTSKEFGELEIITIDGKPYFPATECAKALGHKNPERAIRTHCKGVTEMVTPTKNQYGTTIMQNKNFIPEGDLYRLIIRSRLSSALRFEAWVCDEILVSIRKDGVYITPEMLGKTTSDKAYTASLLKRLAVESAKTDALLDCVGELAPKAQYCDDVLQANEAIPVSFIAKDYGMSAITFNKLLHSLGVQYKLRHTWLLYARHQNKGYTKSKTVIIDDKCYVTTLWTQRGRAFLYDLLKFRGLLPTMERIAYD
jgi:prophage antirepressor-like protein